MYLKYKSGWIEQGGIAKGNTTVTFPLKFKNTNYSLVATGDTYYTLVWTESHTKSNFFTRGWKANTGTYPTTDNISWIACGY